MKRVRVGVIGAGVVGTALLALIERQRDELARRHGVAFDVVGVAVRDAARARKLPVTTDAAGLARDVDLLVEVAGGLAIGDVVRDALARGQAVVTANKALVAAQLGELAAIAAETGAPFACEAAAAGAIPILRALGRRVEGVRSVRGVVNGTCNWLLTRLEQDEQPLADALAGAQARGLAEADPSADLDGHDAAAKLTLLAYRAFGAWVRPSEFPVAGIRPITPPDARLASALGLRIRHLAQAVESAHGLALEVGPALLPSWHLLARVEEEYNAVYLETESAGDLGFFGKGAGGEPTATEVLTDMVDVAQGRAVGWSPPRRIARAEPGERRRFLRIEALPWPERVEWAEGQLRACGVAVRGRAEAGEHVAFVLDACDDARFRASQERLARSARVMSAWGAPLVV